MPQVITKTSADWSKLLGEGSTFKLLDPDGWDRQDIDRSYHQELVTAKEYLSRLMDSTIGVYESWEDFMHQVKYFEDKYTPAQEVI